VENIETEHLKMFNCVDFLSVAKVAQNYGNIISSLAFNFRRPVTFAIIAEVTGDFECNVLFLKNIVDVQNLINI
jgi:hypothetical protein